MPRNGLSHDALVLVCDGRKALFLKNAGDAAFPKLETRGVMSQGDRPTHELGTDKPGRSFSSAGQGRSAVEGTDFHELAEEAFLAKMAEELGRLVTSEQVKAVVLVAPARALGVLREKLPAAARKLVEAEFDKDYVKEPVYEIERHLTELFRKQKI